MKASFDSRHDCYEIRVEEGRDRRRVMAGQGREAYSWLASSATALNAPSRSTDRPNASSSSSPMLEMENVAVSSTRNRNRLPTRTTTRRHGSPVAIRPRPASSPANTCTTGQNQLQDGGRRVTPIAPRPAVSRTNVFVPTEAGYHGRQGHQAYGMRCSPSSVSFHHPAGLGARVGHRSGAMVGTTARHRAWDVWRTSQVLLPPPQPSWNGRVAQRIFGQRYPDQARGNYPQVSGDGAVGGDVPPPTRAAGLHLSTRHIPPPPTEAAWCLCDGRAEEERQTNRHATQIRTHPPPAPGPPPSKRG